jgi:hypothetical protein
VTLFLVSLVEESDLAENSKTRVIFTHSCNCVTKGLEKLLGYHAGRVIEGTGSVGLKLKQQGAQQA